MQWNLKVQNDFIKKLTSKIEHISNQPQSCPESYLFKGLFKCVVAKQTTFYQRVQFDIKEIDIITFFDTRQNPDQLEQE